MLANCEASVTFVPEFDLGKVGERKLVEGNSSFPSLKQCDEDEEDKDQVDEVEDEDEVDEEDEDEEDE